MRKRALHPMSSPIQLDLPKPRMTPRTDRSGVRVAGCCCARTMLAPNFAKWRGRRLEVPVDLRLSCPRGSDIIVDGDEHSVREQCSCLLVLSVTHHCLPFSRYRRVQSYLYLSTLSLLILSATLICHRQCKYTNSRRVRLMKSQ